MRSNLGIVLVANAAGTDIKLDSKENAGTARDPRIEMVIVIGDITAVNAGTGLTGGGTSGSVTLNVDANFIQNRVSGSCAVGSSIRVINSNGTVECETDDNSGGTVTSVAAGTGLTASPSNPITTTGTITVATGGITSAMIADGTIAAADINTADVQKRVSGTCSGSNAIQGVNADGTVNCGSTGTIGGSGTANYVPKFTASTTLGNSAIYESSGNVGIGTTSPGAKLDVAGSVSVAGLSNSGTTTFSRNIVTGQPISVSFQPSTNDGGAPYVRFQEPTSNSFWDIQLTTAGDFTLDRLDSEKFRIDQNGNVGIGTTSPSTRLDVNGTITGTTKNFQIDHPLDPQSKLLVHSALEGPEVAVYYRGEAQLIDGEVSISLPSYFEALTRKEQRTVQLTSIKGWAPLYVADEIRDGQFAVRVAAGGNPAQRFYWEVKAVRADVAPLVVEKLKTTDSMKLAENVKGTHRKIAVTTPSL